MVARSVLPATSRATFASAFSNEEAAPPFRSVASFEKSNRLLNSLPVFPKSKSEMEMGEGGEIGAAAHTTEASREREERRGERDREIDGNKKTELHIYSLFLLPRYIYI